MASDFEAALSALEATVEAAEFQKIIGFKSQAVMAALILFGLGLLLLAAVLVLALLLA